MCRRSCDPPPLRIERTSIGLEVLTTLPAKPEVYTIDIQMCFLLSQL